MDLEILKRILQSVAGGKTTVDDAVRQLSRLSYEDIQYAHIDHQRSIRKGFPEVIFGEGKTAEQIAGIMEKMIPQENVVMVTRLVAEKAKQIRLIFPDAIYHEDAKI